MGIIAEAERQRNPASEAVPDLKVFGLDPKLIEPHAGKVVLLNKSLARERAVELLAELGFLGVVDLIALLAASMEGSIECVTPRFIVKIKQKPRVRKPKPAKKASSRKSPAT